MVSVRQDNIVYENLILLPQFPQSAIIISLGLKPLENTIAIPEQLVCTKANKNRGIFYFLLDPFMLQV